MKKLLTYVLLSILSPVIAIAYGLFLLFKGARKYNGSFPKAHRWYKLVLKKDSARSSDGSSYPIYLKKGISNKLIVFFSGGGMSWSEYSAARPMTLLRTLRGVDSYYFPSVPAYLELANGGMLAAKDTHNPFDDWNVILLPYSSGDFHTGNTEFHYRDLRGRDQAFYHWGAKNVNAALDAVKSAFGNPDQLLIAGESAGAFGCVAQAPNVLKYFPNCPKIAVYSDSAVLFWPRWKEIVRDVWKADPSLSDCLQSDGNLILDWFEWLYHEMGDRVIYLQSCSIHDDVLSTFQNKLNHDIFVLNPEAISEFNVHLNETIQTLSCKIPSYRYFLSEQDKKEKDSSTAHTAARYKRFYSKTQQGVSLADWLNDAVNSNRLYNVGEELLSKENG